MRIFQRIPAGSIRQSTGSSYSIFYCFNNPLDNSG
nr:MAG TPA: hypothetical protein [Caudoviricetes sp.]